MRKTMFTVLGTLTLLTAPTLAQQATTDSPAPQAGQLQTEPQAGQRQPGQRQVRQRQAGQRGPAMRASDLTGMDVRNQQDEDLGSIDDLVIDLQTGQIRYAALSAGGVLGIGDDLYAIPWNAFRLRISDDDHYLVLNVTEQQLENAPGFDKDNWPNMADPQWQTTNDAFYVEQGISTTRRDATGVRRDGVRQDGVRRDDVRRDGVRQDGVQPDRGVRPEGGVRPDRGARTDDLPERGDRRRTTEPQQPATDPGTQPETTQPDN